MWLQLSFIKRRSALAFFLFLLSPLLLAFPAIVQGDQSPPASDQKQSTAPAEEFHRFKIVFEPDAYYTDLDVIIALTDTPIPQLGERTESEIYSTLMSRLLLPRFILLEASINPMPYLGTYLKDHDRDFYDNAQISGSFNWVKALTAGFEEPYASSIFVGNVVDFDVPGNKDIKGKGYTGYLFSMGNYHIKDNELIQDEWREFEWKMKGDRRSPIKKLSWSFRIGAKLHGNPDITDIIYVSFRRSRTDYRLETASLFNNSGFEYTFDMDRHTGSAIRHYFFVDKKWPLQNSQMALSLALGFVWESAKKYTGALAAGRDKDDFQFIIRPNLEF
jgi:hypothetical protein